MLSLPLDRPDGVRYGDRIITWGARPTVRVGDALLGRVIDGKGAPLDARDPHPAREFRELDPPIAILDSVSRLMPAVCSPQHLQKAQLLRSLLASDQASEDLLRIGAYQKGTDPTLDQAVVHMPEIHSLLRQSPDETVSLTGTVEHLLALST